MTKRELSRDDIARARTFEHGGNAGKPTAAPSIPVAHCQEQATFRRMKYQVFADYSFEELNNSINQWLNAVAGLDICHVTQSQIYDPEKGALTTISIFYTETTLGGHHDPVFGGIKAPDVVNL